MVTDEKRAEVREKFAGIHKALDDITAALSSAGEKECEDDPDEAYELGKVDGYSEAVQDIDRLTGGDGEYRVSMLVGAGVDDEHHTPDPETMKQRIVARFSALSSLHPTSADKMEVVAIAWNYMGRPCVDTKFVPDKHAVEAGHITDIEPLARHSDATRIITACQQEVERLNEASRGWWEQSGRWERRAKAAEARNAELVKALDGLLKPFEGDDCRYDHHGHCQAHFLQEVDECCVKIARRVREGGKVDG